MLYRLPEYIDPLNLADKRGEIKGQLPISDLDRLRDLLVTDTGLIEVVLWFGREGKQAKVEGEITTELHLCCQNCLQVVVWPVEAKFKLGIVTTIEQANRLPDDFEPLLVNQNDILVKDLIEDELLLILPTYPKHPYDCLALQTDVKIKSALTKPEQAEKKNPFSILANLKNTGDL